MVGRTGGSNKSEATRGRPHSEGRSVATSLASSQQPPLTTTTRSFVSWAAETNRKEFSARRRVCGAAVRQRSNALGRLGAAWRMYLYGIRRLQRRQTTTQRHNVYSWRRMTERSNCGGEEKSTARLLNESPLAACIWIEAYSLLLTRNFFQKTRARNRHSFTSKCISWFFFFLYSRVHPAGIWVQALISVDERNSMFS